MKDGQGGPASPFFSGIAVGLISAVGLLAGSLFVRIHAYSVPPRMAAERPQPMLATEKPAVAALAPTPAPVPAGPADPLASEYDRLRERQLLLPVDGYDPRQLRDSFHEARVGHRHEAIDLLAPRGTPVRAADAGTVRRLTRGLLGGISVYQADADGRYCYYYAHLDRYAPFLHEGQVVRKGDLLGYVGSTGNAVFSAPHLHFAILRNGRFDDPQSCGGTPINPYRLLTPSDRAAN
jgi:murein DD-endopeptidase MepM/ murein hydrolase activator NlpD